MAQLLLKQVTIGRPAQLLTLKSKAHGAEVNLFPSSDSEVPKEQVWVPMLHADGYAFENHEFGTFAGVEQSPEPGSKLVAVSHPFPFGLEDAEGGRYYIYYQYDHVKRLYLEPKSNIVELSENRGGTWEIRSAESE
ncbi:hypothetical protein FRC11_008565 [Ceratobasidium sp. 423]|nr:hypothetical protein FRC11_008565 [Ceratobasidium sp. 423]